MRSRLIRGKRWGSGVATVVVLGSAALVYATVPNTFNGGDLLSAQKLNDNFNAVVDLTSDQTIAGSKTFSGNIGIRTATPAAPLDVNGTGNVVSSAFNIAEVARFSDGGANHNMGIVFDTGATAGVTALRGLEITKAGQDLSFVRYDSAGTAAPVTDVTITSTGTVGIGTNPTHTLDVQGDIATRGAAAGVIFSPRDGTGSTFIWYNPGSNAFRLNDGAGHDIVLFDSQGNVTATTFTSSSDARLKNDIRPLEHALDAVSRLRGVRFKWKRNSKPSIGVIAQELENVYPELVSTAPDGMKSVDYDKLTAVLIEATKQLRAENLDAAHRIERLESEKEVLKARIDRIERAVAALDITLQSRHGGLAAK